MAPRQATNAEEQEPLVDASALLVAPGDDAGAAAPAPTPAPPGGAGASQQVVYIVPDASTLASGGAAIACPVEGCGRSFSRTQNLELHVRTHGEAAVAALAAADSAPGVRRLYYCPAEGCAYALRNAKGACFSALNKLKRHYASVHSGQRSLACAFCGRAFAARDKQRTHEKWCHVRAWCVCGVSTSTIEGMTANSKARKGHLHAEGLPPGPHALDEARMSAERAARVPGAYEYMGKPRLRLHDGALAAAGAGGGADADMAEGAGGDVAVDAQTAAAADALLGGAAEEDGGGAANL